MKPGSWDIKVAVGKAPQKVASAISELNENLLGAEYNPIAYLGSQVVNGINHAVLAEQILTVGKDIKNVVIIIFNERNDSVTVSAIERVVESGGELGGIQIDVQADISEDVMSIYNAAFEGFVGSVIEPFALLGSQVTKGTNYIFAATVKPVVESPNGSVAIVVVNGLTKAVKIVNLLSDRDNVEGLGYSFTW